jgi:hypothetical protein
MPKPKGQIRRQGLDKLKCQTNLKIQMANQNANILEGGERIVAPFHKSHAASKIRPVTKRR